MAVASGKCKSSDLNGSGFNGPGPCISADYIPVVEMDPPTGLVMFNTPIIMEPERMFTITPQTLD